MAATPDVETDLLYKLVSLLPTRFFSAPFQLWTFDDDSVSSEGAASVTTGHLLTQNTGSIALTTGAVGSGVSFTGSYFLQKTADEVFGPTTPQSFTIGFVFTRPPANASTKTLLSTQDPGVQHGLQISLSGANVLTVTMARNGTVGTVTGYTVTSGTHSVFVTSTTTSLKVYIDGSLVGSASTAAQDWDPGEGLIFGANSSGAQTTVNMQDELAFWRRELSATEVSGVSARVLAGTHPLANLLAGPERMPSRHVPLSMNFLTLFGGQNSDLHNDGRIRKFDVQLTQRFKRGDYTNAESNARAAHDALDLLGRWVGESGAVYMDTRAALAGPTYLGPDFDDTERFVESFEVWFDG